MISDSAVIVAVVVLAVFFGLLFFFFSFYLSKLIMERDKSTELVQLQLSQQMSYNNVKSNEDFTKITKEVLEASIGDSFELMKKQISEVLIVHKSVVKRSEESFEKELADLRQSFVDSSNESLTAIKNHVESEGALAKDVLAKRVEAEFTKVVEELSEYKKTKENVVEQEVREVVNKIAKEVLNKTLSSSEHEKIVIDALEVAKKEGFFGV